MNQPDSLKNGRKKSEMAGKGREEETRNEVGFSTPSPKTHRRLSLRRSSLERRTRNFHNFLSSQQCHSSSSSSSSFVVAVCISFLFTSPTKSRSERAPMPFKASFAPLVELPNENRFCVLVSHLPIPTHSGSAFAVLELREKAHANENK